jgi:hypothetical protein
MKSLVRSRSTGEESLSEVSDKEGPQQDSDYSGCSGQSSPRYGSSCERDAREEAEGVRSGDDAASSARASGPTTNASSLDVLAMLCVNENKESSSPKSPPPKPPSELLRKEEVRPGVVQELLRGNVGMPMGPVDQPVGASTTQIDLIRAALAKRSQMSMTLPMLHSAYQYQYQYQLITQQLAQQAAYNFLQAR